ncbi:hypothetical protein [Bosea sp. (in: a-proteobacteria)]|uniref:hypothetical protein n=1 Tax=Bosea sp. (in: a-proteobacteria) TaxID=1871050 RepID=UPI00262E9BFD|nr:hypothetical protein [Bosea sp. (in: a-proteobacteria)]MCO5091951.1 hypothetical protein [Bosea sp. (in: a-proteobacteria)]
MTGDTRPRVPVQDLEQLRGGDPLPPLRADDHSDADPAVETPVEARQGFLGLPVLMVLIGGLVLAAIAWIGVEMLAY